MDRIIYFFTYLSFIFFMFGCRGGSSLITENNFDPESFNSFIERDFPFVGTYVDARKLGGSFPDDNVVARGLVINLDDSAYVCFDRDLLRWSVAWTGAHLTESMLPQVSNNNFFNKVSAVPLVAGRPAIGNGIYPGWSSGRLMLHEVRPETQRTGDFSWGPLPSDYGRWKGTYIFQNQLVLSYRAAGTDIFELPGVIRESDATVFTRTFEVGSSTDTLYMNAGEVRGGRGSVTEKDLGFIYFGTDTDSILVAGIKDGDSHTGASVRLTADRYLSVVIPPSASPRQLTVLLWRGDSKDLKLFKDVLSSTSVMLPDFKKGSETRWPGEVTTKGKVTPDTATFVTDLLTLPIPNPWKRNVRVTDLAFLDNTTAVVSTFEGDLWIVKGIDGKLEKMSWKRFASGLYEPMSVEVYKGQIYTFGKEGIVRFHDLNGDSEADYYENFSDIMEQSPESYAWAADMVFSEKNNGIIISTGGAVAARPGITKNTFKGFREGSNHAGVVMKISFDGKRSEVISTGFRAPFLGVHPQTGGITATDQQGNYVSSTPIYVVEKGDYFGVPATVHRNDNPTPKPPLTWIPHRIDRSAASQVWMMSEKMGPLNNTLVHFSFGKPGLFKVLIDSADGGLQGGVVPVHSEYSTPILKGAVGPVDGQLYMAGFNLLGSSSKGVSAIQRLRYTGKPSYMQNAFKVGKQGVILSFDSELDPKAIENLSNFHVKRWNYQRTEEYGSGHFKSDYTPGEEVLPVLGAYLTEDRKTLFLLLPDMKTIDQMEVVYKLTSKDGKKLNDGFWFSVYHTPDLQTDLKNFVGIDFSKLKLSKEQIASLIKADAPITRDRGRALFKSVGCIGCHSPGTETDGMYGPPFKGLYGSMRELSDGSVVEADDAYLRESILSPGLKIAKGYEAEMPSYQGTLSDADIDAILMYIMYLKY